jgi:ribonuclease HI
LEGLVGAGAVVEVIGAAGEVGEVKRLRSLGEKQTVWAGEAEGASLALATLLPVLAPLSLTSIHLFIDNQALLLSPFSPAPTCGQNLRLRLRDLVNQLLSLSPTLSITFQWSPGHLDIAGNEAVDVLVKRGADVGIERKRSTGARIELREAMKSKTTVRVKVFRVEMEE